jgi:hypothetical protein
MKPTKEITTGEKIIDSRDVIARIDELRGELDALVSSVTSVANSEDREAAREPLADWLGIAVDELPEDIDAFAPKLYGAYYKSDEAHELAALEALQSQCNYGDWRHGESLIRDDYFEEYAEELASDIGAIDRNANWPMNHIDWKAAAAELTQDYTLVSFDGTDYWIRA